MNADEIARGLSPFAPESAGIRAGRVLLAEVGETIRLRSTFGWESTLAGHAQLKFLNRARGAGFEVEVHYLFVASIDICLQRIRQRVREGGHDVPARDVERRFKRSLANLVHLYLPIADRWTVWNAGTSAPHPILQSPGASLGDVSRILAGR